MIGVKWRAEHPTPTKQDLAVRALMSKCSKAQFGYARNGDDAGVILFKEELEPFIDSFYLLPQSTNPGDAGGITNRKFLFWFVPSTPNAIGASGISVSINGDVNQGVATVKDDVEHKLHPITARRWRDLMLAHPLIGSQLRMLINK